MQPQVDMDDPYFYTINFKGRKTEVSYHHIQQEYNTIIRSFGNLSRVVIDFTFSTIKQHTVDRVMKDLFMIHEIDDERFMHKFHFLENLTVRVFQTEFTNLDFMSYFFIYKNIKSITLECDTNLAIPFFNAIKSSKKVEKIDCPGFYKKHFDLITIDSDTIVGDLDLSGVEDQIQEMSGMIESNNLKKYMDILSKASSLVKLNITIISLQDPSKNFKSIIKNLQENAPLLSHLNILVYLDELVPPIKKDKFKSRLTLEVIYKFQLQSVDYKELLRKIHKFADQNDSLVINPIAEYRDYSLKLNFSKQLLSSDDLKEFTKFISKCNHKLISLHIQFHPQQAMSNKQWVNIINYIGAYEELQSIVITGTQINVSITALSVAKLLKCRKTNININGQTFNNNILSIQLFQLSDYTLEVISSNIFDEKSARIHVLSITAYQIMGQVQPLHKYLSKTKHLLNTLRIEITSSCDSTEFFYTNFKNKFFLDKYVNTTTLSQHKSITFTSSGVLSEVKIDFTNELFAISYAKNILTQDINKIVRPMLERLQNFSTYSVQEFSNYVDKFEIFMEYKKVVQEYKYKLTQPTMMLAFYTILGPEMHNNPYQIYTDLYY